MMIIAIASGCSNASKTPEEATNENGSLIQITKEQFESDRMKIGEATMHQFEDVVRCNGYVMAPANGLAQISTPISGIVQSIKCVTGDFVKKGKTTCTISSIELIEIQRDFIETASALSRLKSDYERSKALYAEKIGAEKDFLAIESEYKAMTAKYSALQMQLKLLNLNTAEIEAGKLYADFPVISPINGYITKQNLQLGQNIDKQISLFEVVDVDQLQLQLSVFEKDVYKLIPGQPVSFGSAGQSSMVNHATLTTIGKAIDPETMTIPCIASINQEQKSVFINRTFIEAAIVVNQINSIALPADAILKSGKDNVVLVLVKTDDHSYYVRKEIVTFGRISNGFAEITSGDLKEKILIEGVYNIQVD
jgi:cobalt-zinc-cadmium efflux system membrane fusion protein